MQEKSMNRLTTGIYMTFCAAAALLSSCSQTNSYPSPLKQAPSYVAIETNTGRVLYSSHSNEKRPIGMLANIACALVVLDWAESRGISMDTRLVVPQEACLYPKTNLLHLRPGDRIPLRDALHSAIMWDDSTCAATMAYACGQTISNTDPTGSFVAQMNQLARTIGMTSTRFKGSHGSIISLSTARDMALLGTYAIQKPSYQAICSKTSYWATVNGTRTVGITNSNRLTGQSSVDGVKAARSASAGACLVVSSTRPSVKRTNPLNGQPATYAQRLLVVLIGMHSSRDRYKAAHDLLRDSWGEWDEWIKTADTSEPNKFIILPQ